MPSFLWVVFFAGLCVRLDVFFFSACSVIVFGLPSVGRRGRPWLVIEFGLVSVGMKK